MGTARARRLSKLLPNGSVKVKDRKDVEQFSVKSNKSRIQEMVQKMINRQKELIEWEIDLVARGKLDASITNMHTLEHPIVKILNSIKKKKKDKRKVIFKQQEVIKSIQKAYCKETKSDAEKLGIKMKELEFGESLICDYHKYGKLLKKKIYEFNKDNGLYLSRSMRLVKISNDELETMNNMDINNAEDAKEFYNLSKKIMYAPINGIE